MPEEYERRILVADESVVGAELTPEVVEDALPIASARGKSRAPRAG